LVLIGALGQGLGQLSAQVLRSFFGTIDAFIVQGLFMLLVGLLWSWFCGFSNPTLSRTEARLSAKRESAKESVYD